MTGPPHGHWSTVSGPPADEVPPIHKDGRLRAEEAAPAAARHRSQPLRVGPAGAVVRDDGSRTGAGAGDSGDTGAPWLRPEQGGVLH